MLVASVFHTSRSTQWPSRDPITVLELRVLKTYYTNNLSKSACVLVPFSVDPCAATTIDFRGSPSLTALFSHRRTSPNLCFDLRWAKGHKRLQRVRQPLFPHLDNFLSPGHMTNPSRVEHPDAK